MLDFLQGLLIVVVIIGALGTINYYLQKGHNG